MFELCPGDFPFVPIDIEVCIKIILDPVLNIGTPHVQESNVNLLSIVRDLILRISDEKE